MIKFFKPFQGGISVEKKLLKTVEQNLKMMAHTIGERPSGSLAHQKARRFIVKTLQDLGYETHEQIYDCPYWKFEDITLKLNEERFPVVPNPFSPPCRIAYEPVCASTLEELEKKDFKEKILVLHGEMTKEPFIPKNFDIFKIEEQEKAIEILKEGKPAAIVAVSHQSKYFPPLIEDSDFPFPSVTVSKETGEKILMESSSKIDLQINCENHISESSNIVARKNISDNEERTILCAHYDTKYGTPGAIDNAAGITAMLTLAQLLSEAKGLRVELVAFGSEDCYYPGDVQYFDLCKPYQATIKRAVNIDGIGMKGKNNSMIYLSPREEDLNVLDDLKTKYPDIQSVEDYFEGDHALFSMRGIPAISLSSVDIHDFINVIIHQQTDTLEKVDPEKIVEIVEFVKDFLAESGY